MRKKFEADFKARVALDAVKGEKTLNELSTEYGAHPNQISKWKQELLSGAAEIFGRRNGKGNAIKEEQTDKLYKSIGELKVEKTGSKKDCNFWADGAEKAH